MSDLYFLEDQGFAIYKNGVPYRRCNPDGVVLNQPPAFSTIGSSDIANFSAFTWDKDDDNTAGLNHKTWSACEMAATYLNGTGGTKTTKSGTVYTLPGNVFVYEMRIPLGGLHRVGVEISGEYHADGAACGVTGSGGWTAPKRGVIRMAVTDNQIVNNVPGDYYYLTGNSDTDAEDDAYIQANCDYPISFYKYVDYYAHKRRCFPGISTTTICAGIMKSGGSVCFVGQLPVHYADATVRSDWLAVRVEAGDSVFFGPMVYNEGLTCDIQVAANSNYPTVDCTGALLYPCSDDETTYSFSVRPSAKMQAAMIFLPDTF